MVVSHDGKPYDVSGLTIKDSVTNDTTIKRIAIKIICDIQPLVIVQKRKKSVHTPI